MPALRVTGRAVEGATTTVAATPAVLFVTLGGHFVAVVVVAVVVLAEAVFGAGVVRRS